MFKKLLLITTFASIGMLKADGPTLAGTAGVLFGAALLKEGLEKAGESHTVQRSCDAANVHPHDVANVAGIIAALIGFGYFSNGSTKDEFYRFAKYAPLAAGVGYMTTTKSFRNVAEKIPVFGDFLSCPNESCDGICKQCILTHGLILVGTYALIRGVNAIASH